MSRPNLTHHRLPVNLELRHIFLRETPQLGHLNLVVKWVGVLFPDVGDEKNLFCLLEEVTGLERLVYHSHVVDLHENEALFSD